MGDLSFLTSAEDFTGEMRRVAEAHGVEVARWFVEEFGGCMFYVPVMRDERRAHVARQAARLYDGTNTAAVCRRLRISPRTLRRMLREVASEARD